MLPAFAYTIEPSNVASSSTMTTFDGAAVRVGPTSPPFPVVPSLPVAPVLLPMNGTCPLSRFSVTNAITRRPTTERIGAA